MGFFDILASTVAGAMQGGQSTSFSSTKSDLDYESTSTLESILCNDNPDDIPYGKEAAYRILLERNNDYYQSDYLASIKAHLGDDDSIYSLYEQLIQEKISDLRNNFQKSACIWMIQDFLNDEGRVVDAIAATKVLAENGMPWSEALDLGLDEIQYTIDSRDMPYIADALDAMRQNG